MKRMTGLAVIALVLGCYGGPPGPPGPRGEPGLQGPQATVPAIVWKNSLGTVIAYGDPPEHKDTNGIWWPVETDFGQVDQRQVQLLSGWVTYNTTNCTGPSFYLGAMVGQFTNRPPFHPPRTPFFVDSENQWRVRADNARAQIVDLQSLLNADGTCRQRTDLAEPVIPTGPASSMVIGPPPDLGSTGPLHKETFQD